MNIKTSLIHSTRRAPSKSPAGNKPPKETLPAWADRVVPSAPTAKDTAVAASVGTAAGLGIGLLAHQLPLGLGIGLTAGLAGALAIHGVRTSHRNKAKHQLVDQQAEQKKAIIKKEELPEKPTAVYGKASVYKGAHNMLVEFEATGELLTVENFGRKKPVEWISEAQAVGPVGYSTGEANAPIPQTYASLLAPDGTVKQGLGYLDVRAYDPLSPKSLEIELSDDGKLSFAHSSYRDGAAVFNLENGDVQSPSLVMTDGVVEKLQFGRYAENTGYRFKGEVYEKLGLPSIEHFQSTLPVRLFGITPSFPNSSKAGTEVKTNLSLKNEGVFAELVDKETVIANYLPKGAQWSGVAESRSQSSDLCVAFQGGGRLQEHRTFEYTDDGTTLSKVSSEVSVDGQPLAENVTALATADKLSIEGIAANGDRETQEIDKDGTIHWDRVSGVFFDHYNFHPDGTVTGQYGQYDGGHRVAVDLKPDRLPVLTADGVMNFGGFQKRLFLSPRQIGAPAASGKSN